MGAGGEVQPPSKPEKTTEASPPKSEKAPTEEGPAAQLDPEAEVVANTPKVMRGERVELQAASGVMYGDGEPEETLSDGANSAQDDVLEALQHDEEKYEENLLALAEAHAKELALAGGSSQGDEKKWYAWDIWLQEQSERDEEALKYGLQAIEEEYQRLSAQVQAGQKGEGSELTGPLRVEFFKRFVEIREELELSYRQSMSSRDLDEPGGGEDAKPLVSGAEIAQVWEDISLGFRSAFEQASTLPEALRDECQESLLTQYNAISDQLWQLYLRAEQEDSLPQTEPAAGIQQELEALKASSKQVYNDWIQAQMAANLSKANESIDKGSVEKREGEGTEFPEAPYQKVEQVKAAQKQWLKKLEVAWLSDKKTILDWVTGNQRIEVQTALYRMGKHNDKDNKNKEYKSGPKPAKGRRFSYEESKQSVQELRDSPKGGFKLEEVELLLLSGALEAKEHFTQMMAAKDKNGDKKKGDKKSLKTMGDESVYRNFDAQVVKWVEKFGEEKAESPKVQKEILSDDGVAAPGFSRHGYGTEYDVGVGFDKDAKDKYGGQFQFLEESAWQWGFFRPFKGEGGLSEDFKALYGDELVSVIAEFWHWSYYPVSQALWELISRHMSDLDLEAEDHLGVVERAVDNLYKARQPPAEPDPKKIYLKAAMVDWVKENVEMIHNGVNTEVGPKEKQ